MDYRLDGETLLYPIIGDPVHHAKSPTRLTGKFVGMNHNGICVPMVVTNETLAATMPALLATPSVGGLLVTMPLKNSCFPYCQTASEVSSRLKVVSVMRRNQDGTWHGDMMDGLAFVAAQKKEGAVLKGARTLQIGAGGVGSAIAFALLDEGVTELAIHDTDLRRRDELVAKLAGLGRGKVTAGASDPTGYDVVVNATPLGMNADDPLPINVDRLKSSTFVGDVVAGEGLTPLLQAARAAGCRYSDGSQMVDEAMEIMPAFLLKR